ncbi:hypothetical protein [Actinobacillus capsulatus]|uniref:hypothetical protein n=1 Tax=Actinobacillus capsulatus TaxID=717 RepID=UPI0003716930|nr:hypothetical protein [Actinobacillus capsulatus]
MEFLEIVKKLQLLKGCFKAINGKTLEEVTLSAAEEANDRVFAGNEVYDTKGQKVIKFFFHQQES